MKIPKVKNQSIPNSDDLFSVFRFRDFKSEKQQMRARRDEIAAFFKYLNYREILIVAASIIFMPLSNDYNIHRNLMKFTVDDCGKRPNWIKKAERCLDNE